MPNHLEQMRALVDKANKQEKWPTGGDGRMTAEVLNTSAIAKNQAIDMTKKVSVPVLGKKR